MKVIVPMAGMGTRLRPVTLTTPKPLVKIAGKPIVKRLLEDLSKVLPEKITDIGFVIGNFSDEVRQNLHQIAASLGAKSHIFIQNQPLGTAHAVYMAKDLLDENVIIAFADTLFITDKTLQLNSDAVIFTKQVEDPSHYGVVVTNSQGFITKFIEKPKQPVSNRAIIGIYYFSNAKRLRAEIEYLLDNKIMVKGEYQLTDALERMLQKGTAFTTFDIDQWLDCGNKDFLLNTNAKILDHISKRENLINSQTKNTIIIPPVYIGKNVNINNSIIGPYVSVEDYATVEHSIISNSIIFNTAKVKSVNLKGSLIGQKASVCGKEAELSISDFTQVKV